MLRFVQIFALSLVVASLASSTYAQSENHPPECYSKVIDMSALAADIDLSDFKVDPINVAPACTDADDDPLNLSQISGPAVIDSGDTVRITQTIKAGESATFDFVVSDSHGALASASLTVTRATVTH